MSHYEYSVRDLTRREWLVVVRIREGTLAFKLASLFFGWWNR